MKKRNNNIKGDTKIIKYYTIITLIIHIFCQIKNNILFELLYFQDSKITLKIKGIGLNIILGNEYNFNIVDIKHLKEVYINKNKQNTITNIYNFTQADNFVELIWDNNINNCEYMFNMCSNITEINLSNFNSSLVISMKYMFYNCSSLTSLDLSNINTSLVRYIDYMFSNCLSLISLNF